MSSGDHSRSESTSSTERPSSDPSLADLFQSSRNNSRSSSSLSLRSSSSSSRLDKALLRSPTVRRISRFLKSPIVKRRTVSTYFPQSNDDTSCVVSSATFKSFPDIDDIEPAFTVQEIQEKFASVERRCTPHRRHEGCYKVASRVPSLSDISELNETCCSSQPPICCTSEDDQLSILLYSPRQESLPSTSSSCPSESSSSLPVFDLPDNSG